MRKAMAVLVTISLVLLYIIGSSAVNRLFGQSTDSGKNLQEEFFVLLSDYEKIDVDMEREMRAFLAKPLQPSKGLVFLTFSRSRFMPAFKKGMTIKALVTPFYYNSESYAQRWAPCNYLIGSKIIYYDRIMLWIIWKAENVEAEKEGK